MIKECLYEIVSSDLDFGDRKKKTLKNYLDLYEEEQLFIIMQQNMGLIMEDIYIHYLPNVGFRCSNDVRLGRNPMCNIIQRILNEKYKHFLNFNL